MAKNSPTNKNGVSVSIPICAATVILVAVLYTQTSYGPSTTQHEYNHWLRRTGDVPTVTVSPDQPFRESMIAKGEPTILRNTVAELWVARKKWNPEYLREVVSDVINNVYVHDNPVFGPLWRPKKPLAALPSLVQHNPFRIQDMSKNEYFDRMTTTNSTPSSFVYYTGNFNTPQLAAEVHPLSEVLIPKKVEHVNIWAGQAGVSTHLHFDTYENFYVQLYGKKRFLIFSPSQGKNLYSFPFLHPSHAQSQLDVDHLNPGLYPNQQRAECMVADLIPGDILYLPPLYWHHVISTTVSIGVNAWSTSAQQERFNTAIQTSAKGLLHTWPTQVKAAAVHYLFTTLYNTVTDKSANQCISEMFALRYSTLVQKGEIPLVNDADFALCGGDDGFTEAERTVVNTLVTTLTPLFTDQPSTTLSFWLDNYLESLALWAVGGTRAPSFIYYCFTV